MADTPVFGNPAGLIGRVNVGGGGTNELRKIEGTLQPNLGVSTVTITGVPFKPKYYYIGGSYTFTDSEQCGSVEEERGLCRIRYTAGEDTGDNGNYYIDANTAEGDEFIGATYDDAGTLVVTVSPPLHQPRRYTIWG